MCADLTNYSFSKTFNIFKCFQHFSQPNNDIELNSNLVNTNFNSVVVRRAFKYYGSLKVLDDLDMTVPKGAIYGLLGPSGCGKTTLLECLLGRKGLNGGDLYVLNQKLPNANNETRIGYMPQNTGLYLDLTIIETLKFFGSIFGMEENKIKERTKYLIELLMLPHGGRQINSLSGGEQRRVSLAVAFLHEPELLILDEPTVGVDTVLRQLIWNHFLSLTKNGNVTVIITTHYIEETIQASVVGVMRGGCLMAEASPRTLLERHQAETLEKVILTLSYLQNQNQNTKAEHDVSANKFLITNKMSKIKIGWSFKKRHMKALIWRNSLWFFKNLTTLLIAVLLPIIMISLFCLSFGHQPLNYSVAVTNLEMGNNCTNTTMRCDNEEISCVFLKYLGHNKLIMKYYPTQDSAMRSVMNGETQLSITLKLNYSSALRARVHHLRSMTLTEMDQSTIDVYRDLSNKHLALQTQITLYKTLESFLADYAESCGIHKKTMKVPITWETVHGWMDPDFTDTTTPGIMLSIVFIAGMTITSVVMLVEYNEVSLERLLVIGISKIELVISHFLVESVLISVQTTFIMIFTFFVFKMTIIGSPLLAIILLMLTGFFGITYGLLVSCITKSLVAIALISTGTYFAIVMTSGIMWPVESVHWLLKPFIPFLPLTKPTASLRDILHKDWNIWNPDVYSGYLSITIWMLIFILFIFILIKYKH